jgi:hypothetical protein
MLLDFPRAEIQYINISIVTNGSIQIYYTYYRIHINLIYMYIYKQ